MWCTGPFEKTDKSAFDKLWDVIARVSGICERAQRTIDISTKTNINYFMRAKKAEDLLKNGCGQIQADFDVWLQELQGDVDESTEQSALYWPVRSSQITKRSSVFTPLTFPPHQFRNAETAQLLVTYWSALITFHKMVSELLVVAEQSAQQGGGSHSQLAYRPSAATSPTYNSSSPQASTPSVSATSPLVSINTSDYSTYSLPNTTQSYTYATSTTSTSFNPQYAPNIFLPQQQTPYINFQPDTYPATTGYEIPSTCAPEPGYSTLFDPSINISMFPSEQADNSFHSNDLAYFNSDPTPSYPSPNPMDYLPPPQRNHTPASYISAGSAPGSHQSNISAPGSYQSHQSPANSFVSSAAVSHVGSHAATPSDRNTFHYASNQHPIPTAEVYTGHFLSLHRNSRPDNLANFAQLIGAGLNFLIHPQNGNGTEVVLLLWPLEVLESMCITTDKRLHCGELRNEMDRRNEDMGRWVMGRRWTAVGVGGEE